MNCDSGYKNGEKVKDVAEESLFYSHIYQYYS